MNLRDDLEIDLDNRFHRRFWKLQRFGWVIWSVVILGAILGFTGPGVYGSKTIATPPLTLAHETIIRYQSPAQLDIIIGAGMESPVRLSFNRAFTDSVACLRATPEPDVQSATGDRISYWFKPISTNAPMNIVVRYEPKRFGSLGIELELDESVALTSKQFVFP